ncbi:MAG: CTP synthase [Candidatus Firestonebacteria bacterium]|nr:CTP synthase [Candidatus Firestonebacteria bacterium]
MSTNKSKKNIKYIFVTGGVVSSLGKGIAAASIGCLLESHGLLVSLMKFDPYINVDPGTMSPFQHGEVFVTDDGAETDLDLGHYERYTNAILTRNNNITTGQIYFSVINKERHGDYLGGTVQVVPHITDEIKNRILMVAKESKPDVIIVEIGGTVGDIESLPFMEAIRQFKYDVGKENVIYLHLTLVPYIKAAGEIKTKPTQHSVKNLQEIGIQPDILLCRTEKTLSPELRKKIALFCNVDKECVIQAIDVETVYEIPLIFHKDGLDRNILRLLNIKSRGENLDKWKKTVYKEKNPKYIINIGVVGKYIELQDAYKSINEALNHGGLGNDCRVKVHWIDAEMIEKDGPERHLRDLSGILIPGGFGERGVEGKISTIKYVRENKIPYFGICLGMQCAVIEFARNVCGFKDAHSYEINQKTKHPVIDFLLSQRNIKNLGGTMRLGAYPCKIINNTLLRKIYKNNLIHERHRHRFEFNNTYRDILTSKGLVISGISPDERIVEVIELKDHPFFIGVQFHPEFKSKPTKPHPIFKEFIKSSMNTGLKKGHIIKKENKNEGSKS